MHGFRGISRYRSVFISDIHLGTKGCRAEYLVDFLKHVDCSYLYLVGDIIDGWRLKRSWYWTEAHNEVVRLVLDKARNGTTVIYIPGNHDEMLRGYGELSVGGILVRETAVHCTADGRQLLVLHGDEFDGVVKCAKWLALIGSAAYGWMISLSHYYNVARRTLGYPYWSLSAWLKHKVKNAVDHIGHFEDAVLEEARKHDVDGVICGHIHIPEIRDINGILYCNDGDWVESCSALVEQPSGQLELVHWVEMSHAARLARIAA